MKAVKMWQKVMGEFPADAPAEKIESTAQTLESKSYEPVLLLKTPGFLRMGCKDIEAEIERVRNMTDRDMLDEGFGDNADFDEFKMKHLQLLVYHYGLLCRLRADDPEAWDTINELYEDD